jgi:hypothetical protein
MGKAREPLREAEVRDGVPLGCTLRRPRLAEARLAHPAERLGTPDAKHSSVTTIALSLVISFGLHMLTLLYIIVVLLLVLANGFLVASEFALVGVRRSRVETLAAQGNRSASRLLAPARPPERLRSVKPTHRSRANATPTAKRWMPMRFRPGPLSNPQAGTAVAVAEVHHGMFRPHVQSAHQALQGRA